MPAPRLSVYSPETVVAEKFEAMVQLGLDNSRIKDFYDLWLLARDFKFDGAVLAHAVKATFVRRKVSRGPDARGPGAGSARIRGKTALLDAVGDKYQVKVHFTDYPGEQMTNTNVKG